MSAVVSEEEKPQTRGDGGGMPGPQSERARLATSGAQGAAPAASSPEVQRRRSLGDRLRLPLMIGVPLLAILAGLYYYLVGGRYQWTDDAYVRAAQVAISSNVSGRVSEVDVRDNERVRRGETLFRLDSRPFDIAVQAARARLATAQLHVQALEANYRQRLADLQSAQSALAYQRREYARQARLLASGITSQAAVDRAALARNQAQQSVAATEQQITSALADLGGNPRLPVERHPGVEQAQAALNRALLDRSYTVIRAPLDGIVTRVDQLQTGDYIEAATPVFALVSTRDVWIEANFKEVQLTHMHAGQSAEVSVDAYPGRKFAGRVASVSPGTGSDFSLLPPENATGNWVKVVQRLPVRIALTGALPVLASGLSATVEVDTRYHRRLFGSPRDESPPPGGAGAPRGIRDPGGASPPTARAGR